MGKAHEKTNKVTNKQIDKTYEKGTWKNEQVDKRMGKAYEKTNKLRKRHVANVVFDWVCLFFIFCRVIPACALTFVGYENVIHFLMPSSEREKTNDWYILLLDTSFTHLHSHILLVETGFPVFILKEFLRRFFSNRRGTANVYVHVY